MRNRSWLRVITTISLLLLLAWGPWWLVCAGAFVGLVYFDWYVEALFLGVFLDGLYGLGGLTHYIFTLSAAIVLIAFLYLKQWFIIESSY